MTLPILMSVTEQLLVLQQKFKKQLPAKTNVIRVLWEIICTKESSIVERDELNHKIHTLKSSSVICNIEAIKASTTIIENTFSSVFLKYKDILPPQNIQQQIIDELQKIDEAIECWQPQTIELVQPTNTITQCNDNLVYLISTNELAAVNTVNALSGKYKVRCFSNITDLIASYKKAIPGLVLINNCIENIERNSILSQLKSQIETFTPIIFITDDDSIHSRLLAAREGAHRYFSMPLDTRELIRTMEGLTAGGGNKPFRVLLIDDDPLLLEYYSILLTDVGMKVQTLTDPLECINAIRTFKPDISVICCHLQGCSGPELAQVIRQNDDWATMPIIFLSSETVLTLELKQMNYGGDDYLVKPVQSNTLLTAVITKAKRACWTNQLNKKLKQALTEVDYYIEAMNQHNIISSTDIAGRITFVNDKFCEITGYRREELIGQNHRMIKSEHHSLAFYKELWKTISNGNVWHGQVCNLAKNGDEYWVEATIVPFLDEKGKPYKYVSARTDITNISKSEERLNRSQEFANIGSFDLNLITQLVECSDNIWLMLGYKKCNQDYTVNDFISLVYKDDIKLVEDNLKMSIEEGKQFDIEYRIVHDNGIVRWMHAQGNITRMSTGEPSHLIGVMQDITERKQLEEVIRESEEKYRLMFELSEEPMWTIHDNKFVMANQAAVNILGFNSIDELTNIHPSELSPENQANGNTSFEEANKMMSIAYKEGYHRFNWTHKKKNGDLFPVDVSLTRTPYKGGYALFCAWRDISKERESERRLASQKQLLDSLHQHTTNFVNELDIRPTMEAMLNTLLTLTDSKYGFVGEVSYDENRKPYIQSFTTCNILSEQEVTITYKENNEDALAFNSLNTLYGKVMTSGQVVIKNESIIKQNYTGLPGEHPSLESFYGAPIYYGDNLVGMYAIANGCNNYGLELQNFLRPFDITFAAMINSSYMMEQDEIKNQALISAKDEAENANLAKSQFLSSMSHELRTPMNVILGFCQLLQMDEDNLNDSQLQNVDEINKAAEHLLKLINEVLELSKIESGQMQFLIENVKIYDVVTEAINLISPLADNRGINISIEKERDVISSEQLYDEDFHILADFTRLKQVLLNLLSNAIKYNYANGKIIITIKKVKNILRLSIQDTGPGISQEQQTNLFTSFNRLGAEYSNVEGTGIGLVITKNITELMGGEIGVESELGEGSSFWLEFPIVERVKKIKSSNQQSDIRDKELSTDNKQSYDVLYIEDNPANLRLISMLFARTSNISMISAPEPLLGIQLATEQLPDLILLDINLPGMSGLEVVKLLKEAKKTCNIPVIAISANAMPEDIEKGMDAGFDKYITKPININMLVAAVESFLDIKNMQE